MRKFIKGGLVYDGTGKPPERKDLVIEDGKILDICSYGKNFWESYSDEILDASGMVVTPGFIDGHRHGDFAALTDEAFGALELAQGMTTMVVGNCGMSAAPVSENSRDAWYAFLEPCLGKAPKRGWNSFDSYLTSLEEKRAPVNLGALVGMGSIRTAVKGFSDAPWTAKELDIGKSLVREALEAGAAGISCGIMYVPECFQTAKEYGKLLCPAASYGRPVSFHIRSEGDHLIEAVDEVLEIGDRAGVPVNISHFKVFGKKNWKKMLPYAIEHVEQARQRGQKVTVDFYPYAAGSTTLLTLIPPACMGNSIKETLKSLSQKEGVAKLRKELKREQPGWDNMVAAIGWERIVLSSVTSEKNRRSQGYDISKICRMSGDEDEAACMARILCEEEGKAGVIVMSMHPDDVDLVARLPYSAVISDALYGASEFPHPRLYGTFPKIIRDFVLERKILTMEQAVHKMTGMPAMRIGMKDRGLIRPGFWADLNLFQPERFCDKANFTEPGHPAEGMEMVMVNGTVAWKQGMMPKSPSGHVLRFYKKESR